MNMGENAAERMTFTSLQLYVSLSDMARDGGMTRRRRASPCAPRSHPCFQLTAYRLLRLFRLLLFLKPAQHALDCCDVV